MCLWCNYAYNTNIVREMTMENSLNKEIINTEDDVLEMLDNLFERRVDDW